VSELGVTESATPTTKSSLPTYQPPFRRTTFERGLASVGANGRIRTVSSIGPRWYRADAGAFRRSYFFKLMSPRVAIVPAGGVNVPLTKAHGANVNSATRSSQRIVIRFLTKLS
jgi:hypothetical protein